MNAPLSTIRLSIRAAPAGAGTAFAYDVRVDAAVIAANQIVSAEQATVLAGVTARFRDLLDQPGPPRGVTEQMANLGADLFELWLRPHWEAIAGRLPPGAERLLVVDSAVATVLDLPWELMRPADGVFFGFSPTQHIRRLPAAVRPPPATNGVLPAGPLRILFMVCAPQDQPALDEDREAELLYRAIADAKANVVINVAELGTFAELRQRLADVQPHFIHLTGHATISDGLAHFAFEDERGGSDFRSVLELRQLLAERGVRAVFISGRQAGRASAVAATGALCQELIGTEVPLAIGWATSVADQLPTGCLTAFYGAAAAGEPIDRALTLGRMAIREQWDDRGEPSWTLPVLYAAGAQTRVVDPDPARPPAPPPPRVTVQLPITGMTDGYTALFVGRRREQQRLLPRLRSGELQVALLTGAAGVGKSTLATKLARQLEAEGWRPVAVATPPGETLSPARLLETFAESMLALKRGDEAAALRDPQRDIGHRLRSLVRLLNRERFVVILDNVADDATDTAQPAPDPAIAAFYGYLLHHLAGESRVIITSCCLPADLASLPPLAHEERLDEFQPGGVITFLVRDPIVERRYRVGELPPSLPRALADALGSDPRTLSHIRVGLRTMTKEALARELAKIVLPAEAAEPRVRAARAAYLETIFIAPRYDGLPLAARRALSLAAVYGVAVHYPAMVAVSGEPIARIREWTRLWYDAGLAYPVRGRAAGELWTVAPHLRRWLLAPPRLSADELRTARVAAGEFLCDVEADDRAGDLGLTWVACLDEARSRFLEAGAWRDARQVSDRLSDRFVRQGYYGDVIRLNAAVLAGERHPGPLSWIGRAHLHLADYAAARRWYQQSLAAAGETDRAAAGVALHGLASLALYQGDEAEARTQFTQALAIARATGDRAGEAATRHQLATLALKQGDYPTARTDFTHALTIQRSIGDRAGEAAARHQLATLALRQDDFPVARAEFDQALAIFQALPDQASEAATRHQLAILALKQSDYPTACAEFSRSLAIRQAIGDRAGERMTFHRLGKLAEQLGRGEQAVRLVALCWMIDQAIEHADLDRDRQELLRLAAGLGYSPERVAMMVDDVMEAYQRDRGRGLAEAALPNE